MKVKVVANELVDTDIEMVSLVRHGANRCPFKILKTDEDDRAETLGSRLQNFFSLAREDAVVTAYYVRADAADKVLPVLKAEGVDVEAAETADGVTRVVVSDVPTRGLLQLTDALAVGVSHPLRDYSDESVVKAYAESIGLQQFAPGVDLALAGLAGAVWSLLNPANGGVREERVAKVDSLLASFRKYVTGLARALPEQVFKVEAAAKAATTEEHDMRTAKLSEAVAGDLGDLLKTEEPAAAAPVVKSADGESMEEEAAEGEGTEFKACAACKTPAECGGAKKCAAAAAAEGVAKTGEGVVEMAKPAAAPDALSSILAALTDLGAKVDGLAKSVKEQQEVTDSLSAQFVEAREDLAKAETVRRATTIVDRTGDMDLALSTLGGSDRHRGQPRPVVKSAEEVWDGLMPDLESFRRTR